MENGMRHGRLPIADGAVDKENVKEVARSNRLNSTNNVAYLSVIDENEQLKEMCQQLQESNSKLQQTNEILTEENTVGRDLSLRLYEQLNKEAPADLLARLASLENRRNKITCSSHAGSCQDDMHSQDDMCTDSDDDDYDVDEESSDGMDQESSDGMDEDNSDGMDEENSDGMDENRDGMDENHDGMDEESIHGSEDDN
ncbi:unnamed protein product [Urochloa humidicola]